MRDAIKFFLARHPGLYDRVLRLKHRKEYDNERIVFLNAVRDGDTVYDIGANRGIHTVLLSHLAGPKGEVFAFEPVPPTFAMLSQNVAAKKRFDNIRLMNTAVGDMAGTVTINMPDGDDGQASMAKHGSGSWDAVKTVQTFECPVTTLDVCSEKNPPAFIKCDVEGAELLTLRGGKETLARHAPMLFLEICKEWTHSFGYMPLDILNFVKPYGYDIFHQIDDHGIRRLDKPEEALDENNLGASIDLLCSVSKLHRDRVIGLR